MKLRLLFEVEIKNAALMRAGLDTRGKEPFVEAVKRAVKGELAAVARLNHCDFEEFEVYNLPEQYQVR